MASASLKATAQLVRLPNVFTALADVALGAFVAGLWSPGTALLALASACLYSAGMAFNDWFDLDVDRRERPARPLPAGRLSPRFALGFGSALLALGVVAAWFAGGMTSCGWALGLVAAILLYDGWLKRTNLGPISMAACRFLNVLLALSLADVEAVPWPLRLHLAGVVGVYIVGVTWFARQEAETSRRDSLTKAALVIAVAFALALALPTHRPAGTASPLFPYLLVAFGLFLGGRIVRAIRDPSPGFVQAAVKSAVLGLVVLDALAASALAGSAGLLILLLLPPGLWLGRWLYST